MAKYLETPKEMGVMSFLVEDIPPEIVHDGVYKWKFKPVHKPERKNYYHSEIQAFLDEKHIDADSQIPRRLQLRWRDRLYARIKIKRKPYSLSKELGLI